MQHYMGMYTHVSQTNTQNSICDIRTGKGRSTESQTSPKGYVTKKILLHFLQYRTQWTYGDLGISHYTSGYYNPETIWDYWNQKPDLL